MSQLYRLVISAFIIFVCLGTSRGGDLCRTGCELHWLAQVHPLCYRCACADKHVKVTCTGKNLTEVPDNLPSNTTKLYLSGTGIREVHIGAFSPYPHLVELFFRDTADPCQLERLEPGVFDNLTHLETLGMIGCGRLTSLAAGVLGTFQNLEIIHIYRSGLTSVPDFSQFQTIKPQMEGLMKEIDLHNNNIEIVETMAFLGIKTATLKLDDNAIERIERHAFMNATIVSLALNQNKELTFIDQRAFDNVIVLDKLDLSYTRISTLPTAGLGNIKELVLKHTPTLKQFPSVLDFRKIERAELFYPHHCCAFKNPEKQNPEAWKTRQAQERINRECATTGGKISPSAADNNMLPGSTMFTSIRGRKLQSFGDFIDNTSRSIGGASNGIIGSFYPVPIPIDDNVTQNVSCGKIYVYNRNIKCTPEPDAFNPCEDVMGYFWLRITIWFVFLAALLGNVVVLIVLITSRGKFTVPKFLMCNLAFADFLMGVYLMLLASVDIHTLGEYFNYAVQWQNEGGCQAAGFLSVFSSELSVFTLTIITLERWYAISHAIHLNKRLKLRQSLCLMAGGYVFAVILALLPLLGISGYGNVSICLPMRAESAVDVSYVISLLVMNGLMFIAICLCYVSMYWTVKDSDCTARSNDATIAKRMALLVFTNFVCWAPIAFFGLTASAGLPLIDITHSKILLVFFYPLNSCANPFLYAILTKQFRKDVFILLGRYGLCVERANIYRGGTFVSRSMSHSRLGKDHCFHAAAHHNESLLTHIVDSSNNSSKVSVSSTPKIHPTLQKPDVHSFMERSHVDRAVEFANKADTVTESESEPWEAGTTCHNRRCPYIRSVSEYISFNSKVARISTSKTGPRQQVSVDTCISSGTDTTVVSDSSQHGDTEDIWQLGPSSVEFSRRNKLKPFPCNMRPEEEELRLSHCNCYALAEGTFPLADDDAAIQQLLQEGAINIMRTQSLEKCVSPVKTPYPGRYKFARSPSLSSLEETVEHPLLPRDVLRSRSSSNFGNEMDSLCTEGLRTDKSKESGFHSAVSLQGQLVQDDEL